ncbi:hypothetical protein UA08_04722 [Talaromyces atroroseus]|uniref:Uncharacterized protein n=1 Tax=Talaromyces atroroseus TaxID=1441469 RepID=A0A225AN89_TALAT|nr:hypothetical protein UA08_04722 [Talaromyces atroroseus]OKL59824.1 hypothetical protein UA08_04722 [Talaromyces atroroseus]
MIATLSDRCDFSLAKESMLRVSQPATGLLPSLNFRHSTPPVLTPIHSSTADPSSSEEEDEEEEREDDDEEAKRRALRRQRASSRPKTVLHFAHPVANRRRLKLRLKLLLQLHEINRSSRPFPKFDVLPADVPTRLICKLPKPYGTTRAFGAKDMVVVTSDMYEQQQTLATSDDRSVSSDESCVEQREVIATICQCGSDDSPRKSKFEVAFSSGVYWEGIALPNGSYELVSQGGSSPPRKVRWVARDKKPVRQASGSSVSSMSASRFTFSVINPNTRQHPVIASMTRKGLTVFDQFSYPAAYSGDEQSPPASPSTASSSVKSAGLVHTDEDLRKVIVMTGIWVAFMEGWASKSLLSGEVPNASTLSPRARSSTYLSADGDAVVVETGSTAGSSASGRPSRLNSFSRQRTVNRRSTQSEFGREIVTEPQKGICNIRRSKSLTSADRRDLKWTSVEAESAPAAAARDAPADLQTQDEDPKTKSRGWRRFSSILRRKKR